MKTIGATQNASAAQIAIAWAMAKGTLPLIGATKIHHVTDAAQAAQLKLDANDIATPENWRKPRKPRPSSICLNWARSRDKRRFMTKWGETISPLPSMAKQAR